MSVRELVVLGSASQVPTRHRNHNGYLLRWDAEAILFDPGEGTQRQMTLARVSPASVTRICISHFHGDHCLGLPGVLQRLSLERPGQAVDVYFPAGGAPYLQRLRHAAIFDERIEVREHPLRSGATVDAGVFLLRALALDHRVETLGWRIEEPPRRTMLPDRLEALGVAGPDIGTLQREGSVTTGGRRVTLEEASTPRRSQSVAVVLDTRMTPAAAALARDVDLLVCEATFLERDQALAHDHRHLTAAQAGALARDANVGRLVLTHFSQRYDDDGEFVAEAARSFPDVVAARDLMRVSVPRRT